MAAPNSPSYFIPHTLCNQPRLLSRTYNRSSTIDDIYPNNTNMDQEQEAQSPYSPSQTIKRRIITVMTSIPGVTKKAEQTNQLELETLYESLLFDLRSRDEDLFREIVDFHKVTGRPWECGLDTEERKTWIVLLFRLALRCYAAANGPPTKTKGFAVTPEAQRAALEVSKLAKERIFDPWEDKGATSGDLLYEAKQQNMYSDFESTTEYVTQFEEDRHLIEEAAKDKENTRLERLQDRGKCIAALFKFWNLLAEPVKDDDKQKQMRKEALRDLNIDFAFADELDEWEREIAGGLVWLDDENLGGRKTILEDNLIRQAVRLMPWDEFAKAMPRYKEDAIFRRRYGKQVKSHKKAVTEGNLKIFRDEA
ncbi:hypothetical protein CC80DRAFT_576858 [Byssothecium circinans]|uniref:Uncharacterized protein n=1 Tax=Byssothecium circinans TaxID=147558 RepID=A0A6A5TIF4_9PLEO|nr:hypothetical protein CC80DRAFT_576858 [Byssothecium circinans]